VKDSGERLALSGDNVIPGGLSQRPH